VCFLFLASTTALLSDEIKPPEMKNSDAKPSGEKHSDKQSKPSNGQRVHGGSEQVCIQGI
jgi:hypothetical protein